MDNLMNSHLVHKTTSYAFEKTKGVFKRPMFWIIFLSSLLFIIFINNLKSNPKYEPDLKFMNNLNTRSKKPINEIEYEEPEELDIEDYNYINQSLRNEVEDIEVDFDKVGQLDINKEELCCKILSEIYEVKFEKIRPDWLKNPYTNKSLELDCYSYEYGVALEYQGIQHYKFPNPFHKAEQDFIMQKQRDIAKKYMCESKGILYIEVPYYIPVENLKKYIENKIVEKIKKGKLYST